MARYGKTNNTVANMVARALYKGEAKAGKYEAKNDGCFLTLTHYGTDILVVNIHTKEVKTYGGFSMSDAEAINTTLDLLEVPDDVFCRYYRKERRIELIHDTIEVVNGMKQYKQEVIAK